MRAFPFQPLAFSIPSWARRALIGVAGAALWLGCAHAGVIQSPGEAGGEYAFSVVSYVDMPFRTVVRQKYDFSCGSAALATLLRYQYGRDVDEASVFKAMFDLGDQAKIRKFGFSLGDMRRYLKDRGLRADGYRLSLARFATADTPAIAVIKLGNYKHFVVIKSIRGGEVLVGDPALGLKRYAVPDFEKVWDGLVFVIHDDAHPRDHHGFDSPREWAMLARPPFETITHQPAAVSDSTLDEISTVFEILPPNLGSTNLTFPASLPFVQ
jgi:predicted double-glycine peptidase